MEIVGVIIHGVIIYVVGGLLGWGINGILGLFSIIGKGWDGCFTVIVWVILFFFISFRIFVMNTNKDLARYRESHKPL